MEQIYRMSAFPKTKNGGNKAGIVYPADYLSEEKMQSIANEVGYSETAFVLNSNKADFRVRFFSPVDEVDLCGHATIATFNFLRNHKVISKGLHTQETKAGILRLDIRDDVVFMEQLTPTYSELIPFDELAGCFETLEQFDRFPPQIVSTGLREIFLQVSDQTHLNQIKPNNEAIRNLCEQYDIVGIHVFCLADEVDAYGRNFLPIVGIEEESATGTSNGALACYLYHNGIQKNHYTLRQGYSMNQPSEIVVNLKSSAEKITEVWVGGTAIELKHS